MSNREIGIEAGSRQPLVTPEEFEVRKSPLSPEDMLLRDVGYMALQHVTIAKPAHEVSIIAIAAALNEFRLFQPEDSRMITRNILARTVVELSADPSVSKKKAHPVTIEQVRERIDALGRKGFLYVRQRRNRSRKRLAPEITVTEKGFGLLKHYTKD